MSNSFTTCHDTARLAAFRCGIAFCLLLTCAVTAVAQVSRTADGVTPRGLAAGSPAGSYGLSELESVNLYNGQLSFNVPVLHVGGRGTAELTVVVRTSRPSWTVKRECFNSAGTIHSTFIPDDSWWSRVYIQPVNPGGLFFGRPAGTEAAPHACPANPNDVTLYYAETRTTFTFIAPDGTEYEFYDVLNHGNSGTVSCETGNAGLNRGRVFSTRNGSGATFISDYDVSDQAAVQDQSGNEFPPVFPADGYLLLKDGTRYRIGGGQIQWIRDRNGNKTTFYYESATGMGARVSKIVDSLGREAYFDYDGPLPVGRCWRIRYKGTGGVERAVTIAYSNLSAALSDGTTRALNQLFPGTDSGSMYNPAGMVQSVTMPDNRGYQFWYNAYAELARVKLPTGGKVEYVHEGGELNGTASGLIGQYDQSQYPRIGYCGPTVAVYRRLVQRSVFRDFSDDATLAGTTTYSKATLTPNTSGNGNLKDSTVTVSQFEGGASGTERTRNLHTFYGEPIVGVLGNYPISDPSWEEGREYQIEDVDPQNSKVLRRVVHTWANAEMPGGPRITATTITLEPQGANKVSKQGFDYDQYNNQTDVYDYDYGDGVPGALKRHVHTDYLPDYASPAPAYNSPHMRSLPWKQYVYDAGGIKKSSTEYEYDNYTADALHKHEALVGRSGITGLCTAYTPPATTYPPDHVPGVCSNDDPASYTTRGNVTATTRHLLNPDDGAVVGSFTAYEQYDVAGNVVKSIDPRGNATTFDFADRFGTPDGDARLNPGPTNLTGQDATFTYPTAVTNALGHTARTQYDYFTGRPVDAEDANGVVISSYYQDTLDRLTKVVRAVGDIAIRSQTVINYEDDARTVTTANDLKDFGDGLLKTQTLYDGLGRTTESRRYETPDAYVTTQTLYDGLGRVEKVSNPYRPQAQPAEGPVWTTTTYDALGRLFSVASPDGAKIYTLYYGNRTLVTDQALKQRISISDALGRLTDVWEVVNSSSTDPAALSVSFPVQQAGVPAVSKGYRTSYTYDALDNPLNVAQGEQTRTFVYDSLGRATSATNPESGTVGYEYDANGNLKKKTDPRLLADNQTHVVTTYEYDELNRAKSRTYNDGTPNVTYTYDTGYVDQQNVFHSVANAKGRLTQVKSSASAYSYLAYDPLGRVTGSSQTLDGVTYSMPDYRYDRAGNLTSEQYPSGRVVVTEYDGAGRVAGVKNPAAGRYYAGGDPALPGGNPEVISYAAHGAASAVKLGNGLWEHTTFNSRLQPTQIGLGTSAVDSGVLRLDYGYGATDDNGNVRSQTITVPGAASPFVQTYSYDELNRLATAEEKAGATPTWGLAYSYDRYGNRSLTGAPTDPATRDRINNPAVSTATNRITSPGYAYDAAGNLLCDPQHPCGQGQPSPTPYYGYDADNRMKSAGGTTYSYDGDGRRVKKATYNGEVRVFVYDAPGRVVAEYANWAESGGTRYLTQDSLGSTRVVTNANGVVSRHDYYPFGQEAGAGVGGRTEQQGYVADNVAQKFTGYERDAETGLDYAQARYYSPSQGRFTSPDPLLASSRTSNPQTWNRFNYCGNNPLICSDPSGLDWYYNSGQDRYQWYKNAPTEDGWTQVVGDGFVYESKDRGWVALDPQSANWKGDFASKEAAQGLVDTWWSASPNSRALASELGGRYGPPLKQSTEYMFMYMSFFTGPTGEMGGLTSLGLKGGSTGIASGMGATAAEMTVVRIIGRGEAIADIVNEGKGLTFVTGNEHAVVTLANGERALVSGGSGGINFGQGQITRLFGHTHPYGTSIIGASAADRMAIRALGQRSSWLVEGGKVTKFTFK